MKHVLISIKIARIALILIISSQICFGQSVEEKAATLTDLLYSTENFQVRFGNALDNNPTFNNNVDDTDFIKQLTAIAKESALGNYSISIQKALIDQLSENQIDSLITLMGSPSATLILSMFEIDNSSVEKSIGVYVNQAIDQAFAEIQNQEAHTYIELTFEEEVRQHQAELNEFYLNSDTSPLSTKKRKKLEKLGGHAFFDANQEYRITANFEVYENPDVIEFKTSTERLAKYNIYGKASFSIEGKKFEMLVYQNAMPPKDKKYKNHLFLPFTDLTCGVESYGGGRYIDLWIPEDPTKITIDFNQSYHPYCAYSYDYSCPIPPIENFLNTRIEAGVKLVDIGDH